MSLVKVNRPEKNTVEFELKIDKQIFDTAIQKIYKKNVQKMNVPGFRKGKAPRSLVEKLYGKGVFYEDALNDILPGAFSDALKESGEKAVSAPEYDIVSLEDGVEAKAKFFVKPEVAIANYKGIKADRPISEATDEEVDDEINKVRERNARSVEITDRSAKDGDTVVIDYSGNCDGEAFEGGSAENHRLKLGSGQFIPGFEEQIIGHNIGDEFDVNVKFPEEYHAEDLKGKNAVFAVKLNSIEYDELPELDDEFAKDISEFDTFDEYKADVKAKINDRKSKDADNTVEEAIINVLIDELDADIPEPMFESETENFVRDYDMRLRMQGLDLDTFFGYTGQNLDTMRAQFKPQAERQVKTRLALEKIAEIENITASEEDIEDEYKRMTESYNMELEKVKEMVPAESLAEDIKVKKAIEFVKENAEITDVPEVKETDVAEDIESAEAVQEETE